MLLGHERDCKQVLWFCSKHNVVPYWKAMASVRWIQGNGYLFLEVFSGLIGWVCSNSMALYSSERGAGKATNVQCSSRHFTLLYSCFPSFPLHFPFFSPVFNVSSLQHIFSLWVWCSALVEFGLPGIFRLVLYMLVLCRYFTLAVAFSFC